MNKQLIKNQSKGNIKNHNFFIFSEIPTSQKRCYKAFLDCADNKIEIMHGIKRSATLAIKAKLGLGLDDKHLSDADGNNLIKFFKKNYSFKYYFTNNADIRSYYAIQRMMNRLLAAKDHAGFEKALLRAATIYKKHFGDFNIFDNFNDFSNHTMSKYDCCEGFDREAFGTLCKSDEVDESRFMQLTFQGISRPLQMKTFCT